MAGLWDSVRYGFSPVYWLQVAGIPVVFIERASGLTLPAGYTSEDASLSIDASAEVGVEQVDRETGQAVSLALTFKLLDTSTVRDWLRAPSKTMRLTADLSATGASATVDDSTGWSNGEAFYIGQERATIGTVATSTSLTGITRETVGTLPYKHEVGTTSQLLTDRPRFWKGKDVVLWASPCDANGYICGATLAADAVQVWRGRIEEGPSREVDGFTFQAASLDRGIQQGLAGSVSGVVTSTSAKFPVSKGYTVEVSLRANNNAGAAVWQYVFNLDIFASDSDGDLLTAAQIRDRCVTAMATAVTAEGAGGDVGALAWHMVGGVHTARLALTANASIVQFERFTYLDGVEIAADLMDHPNGFGSNFHVDLGWQTKLNPLVPNSAPEPVIPWTITIRVDDGNPGDIAASGLLRIKVDSGVRLFKYTGGTTNGVEAYVVGLTPADGVATWPTKEQMIGADVEVVYSDTGTFPTMMLRALMSSGTGERSATYDTLARAQGYGLDEDVVADSSFTSASAPVGTLKGVASSGGMTFAGIFGGLLGLFRRAVVARPDPAGTIKLRLVSTAPYGAEYATTIADTDLLSHESDPVVSVKRADAPNVVAVLRPHGTDTDEVDRFIYVDRPSIDARGRSEVEYRIPAATRKDLAEIANSAAVSQLGADQTTQAIELRVPPWVVAEVGDGVWLNLTHPALWTWATSPGAPGYTGFARVLGRTLELATSTVRLTLLADASVKVTGLSPAALVLGFDLAAAPSYIDVGIAYLPHFENALAAAGGNIWVNHYKPGQVEVETELHEISAAATVGGNCRLTIDSTSGGHSLVLADESTLTLPSTDGGNISAYQANFAHVADGTQWG